MTVHDMRQARQARKPPRKPSTPAFGTAVLGIFFALVGALIGSLAVERGEVSGRVFLSLITGAFMVLFGTSMAWQSVRGEPTAHGFFIRWLDAIGPRLSPAGVLLALLGFGLLSLSAGMALQSAREVDFGRSLTLAWIAFHFQVLFHEWGHWFAGRACGLQPFRVVGGALSVSLRGGRWLWHANRDWRFLMGGAVFVATSGRWSQDFLFVAAGPLASAVLVYVCMQLGPMTAGIPILNELVGINAGLGLVTLIFNLIPFRFGDMASDGLQLYRLLKRL